MKIFKKKKMNEINEAINIIIDCIGIFLRIICKVVVIEFTLSFECEISLLILFLL